MEKPSVVELCQNSVSDGRVDAKAEEYLGFHNEAGGGDVHKRKTEYTTMVNDYYDLVTDFYEYGWGQSFHFAPRHKGESFAASIARHEFFLASQLGLKPGMKAVDFGCGIGGPMRAIARFSGARVTGLNNNDYQIKRGTRQNQEAHLEHLCGFLKCDFLKVPVAPGSFDAAYAIEATCHAPSKTAIYGEIFRVLKPGAHFAAYEWCMTPLYDSSNAEHRAIKKGIEEGDALPDIWGFEDVLAALREVGFEVLDHRDLAPESDAETPWYLPLADKWYTVQGFRMTPAGQWMTHQMVRGLETLGVAPKGSVAVSSFLREASKHLVAGGKTGIFTPMYYFHVRRPK